jgi:hypothetical protein
MDGDHKSGPKIPIPGVAGISIDAALSHLAVHHGEGELRIRKKRDAQGKYVYVIEFNQLSPENPENLKG